ncbi:hypothetical protein PISMIDRAFT_23818 [Pisolithus microcarpus 441]|uniref:Major facilitator superfamily (MFS) profile domain-containing protein n=1 Tax=Pisolithus microcarpus 441 TaxID=765257 RepID=A0A0C9ZQT7_9AGAM|nr:hypothetical protein PISMIDRAFT_23818 [Pisolithus microcarpus 441]
MSSPASPHDISLKEKDGEVRVDVLQAGTQDIYSGESLDPVYHAKAKILNNAIQEIGMGKYQVYYDLSPRPAPIVDHRFIVVSFFRRRIWLVLEAERLHGSAEGEAAVATSARAAALRKIRTLDMNHVKPLFATRKLAYSTCLLMVLWGLIGLAFPLYNAFVTYYLETRGSAVGQTSVYTTYRNMLTEQQEVILSVIGVPGALMAGYLVELPILGRRGTLAIFTALTGVFILASTTATTSNSYLAWNCGYSYTSNVMYGVLYALSPEIFPTKNRGTGNAIVATANRIFGLMSPIIALETSITTSIPIWVAGGIFVAAGVIALLLPFEPRGKASL